MDDLLLRALDGDSEAAAALRRRQAARLELVAAAAGTRPPSSRRRHPTHRSSSDLKADESTLLEGHDRVVRDPHSHEWVAFTEGLLENALSGSGVWLDDGHCYELLCRERAAPASEPSLIGTLALIQQRASRQEQLESERRARDAELDAARAGVSQYEKMRDELLSQLAQMRREMRVTA